MRPIISPRDLAIAIGVSESSLKRWADDGLVRVSRTAGGHRRIAIGEAIRFVRSIRATVVRPDVLGLSDLLPEGEQVVSSVEPEERLFVHLCEGRAREVRGLLVSLYLSGKTVAEIADGPIRAALTRLGELWKHDPSGIYIEHRATDLCIQAVQQLRQFVEPNESNLAALGGALSGDPYMLPSLLAATALAENGWHAQNLGPDTPCGALLAAVERHRPRLVWLSFSSIRGAGDILEEIDRVARPLGDIGIVVAIGGRALADLTLPAVASLRHGASMADLVLIANESLGLPAAGEQAGA